MGKKIEKVAIIHDWLTGMRGGEAVLEALLDIYPDADLYTLLHNEGSVSFKVENRKIFTSFINRLPFKKNKYRHYLPLFPVAIETFDFHGYDLVISSSHCVARGVIVPPGTPHVSFVHSPMRYVWDMYQDYFPPRGFANRFIIPYFATLLRIWDVAAAHRVDRYVSNSKFVASRIERFYGKKANVVHPPCLSDDHKVTSDMLSDREDFYLMFGALVPYKKADIAVKAFAKSDKKLIIAGKGPELEKLKSIATPNVTLVGAVNDDTAEDLLRRARGLLFPGLEDFGIVPVEAQAYGCPVIAYGAGGALETVIDGKTGLFFSEQSEESLLDAIQKSESIKWKAADFQKSISRFTYEKFINGMKKEIALVVK